MLDSQWPLSHALKVWHALHKPAQPGDSFVSPSGQLFVVHARAYYRFTGRKNPIVALDWQSHCALCGEPYVFRKYLFARSMIRTCPAHRGAMPPAPRPKRDKPARAPYVPPAPFRDFIVAELEALAQAGATMPRDELEEYLIDRIERGEGRDARCQNVRRVLAQLEAQGLVA